MILATETLRDPVAMIWFFVPKIPHLLFTQNLQVLVTPDLETYDIYIMPFLKP